jgi:holo-[acyl-carrier protein] synthase
VFDEVQALCVFACTVADGKQRFVGPECVSTACALSMTILGIGIDVVHLPRFAAFVSRRGPSRVSARILSSSERVAFKRLPAEVDAARYLAVRWAVKEAAYKALYPAATPTWGMVSYTGADREKKRKPGLALAPELARQANAGAAHVSVSHDGDYVFAQVLVERDDSAGSN